MNYLARLPALCLLLTLLLTAPVALAEQKQTLGKWDVHYIVVNTTFFTPETAQNYGIVRSKYNALVNISVLDSATGEAQVVSVKGQARNLLGNSKTLNFKRVKEGEAIYYLAPLSFNDRETFRFNVVIQRGNEVQTLKFQQEMFVE
ncbi:DUF4426 domain-containing protein [Alteromonas sp. NFXS44]|uniref:DUF4426 domain-containing protein n=1 Tax=Alteromonas sp. NFXS44 TaxID=2818435 RepID=UPI0032DE357B